MAEQEGLGARVLTNSVFNFAVFGINRAGGLIFTILLARMLKPELFGLYNLALSITLIILTLANFGIDEALTRYVSKYYRKNKKKARAYFDYLFKLKVWVLVIGAAILIVVAKPVSLFYGENELVFPLVISAFYLVLMSLSQFFSSLFYTFQKVNLYSVKELIFQLTRVSLLPLILLFAFSFRVSGVFFVLIIASVITLAFTLIVLTRKQDFLFEKSEKNKIDKKEIYDYLKFLTVGSITGIFLLYIDVLILGKFVSLEYLGFYKAASSIILGVIALITLTPVLYPVFSEISEKEKLNRIFNKISYYTSVISIPATIGLIFVAKPFIRAIFGYDYLDAVIPLYALAFLVFSFTIGDLFTIALNSHGKSKYTARATIFATVLNVILNFALILAFIRFGEIYALLGAAIATAISRYSGFFMQAHYARKLLNIEIEINSFLKPFIASIGMAVFLIIFNMLTAGKLNLLLGFIEIGIATILYFSILFLIKGIKMAEIRYIIDTAKTSFLKKNKR